MNKKLIAVAVASAVAAPAVYADGHEGVKVYGRINNAITINDTGGSNNTDVSTVGSRFGIKASSDLGNGMTASARYEFATTTDKELNNIADLRIGTVGISGGFGSITIGNQWSAFFDTVGTDIDPAYSLGFHLYSSVAGAPYRASNTIKYSNSFGPVYLEADLRINESEEGSDVAEKINGDGYGIGARISATDNLTFGLAFDREEGAAGEEDTDRTGISARLNAGSFYGMIGYHEYEKGADERDHTQVWVGTTVGSTTIQLGVGSADQVGGGADGTIIGVYHNMGGGLKLYYEGADIDGDPGVKDDVTTHILGMRIDF